MPNGDALAAYVDPQALQRKAGQRPVPVHGAGCQDTAREARRSDSTGAPEGHASKAEVVGASWAGIIAEDPDTSALRAAWPAWKPRPFSWRALGACPMSDQELTVGCLWR